jgi:hypothetical protein
MMMPLSQSTPIAAKSGTHSHAPAGPGYRCPRPPLFVVGKAIRHNTSRIASLITMVSGPNVKAFAICQFSAVSGCPNVRLVPFRMASPAELNVQPGPTRPRALHPRAHRLLALQRSASALLPLFPVFASQLSLFSAPGTELVTGWTVRQISRDESLHFIPIAPSLPHTASRISQFSAGCAAGTRTQSPGWALSSEPPASTFGTGGQIYFQSEDF